MPQKNRSILFVHTSSDLYGASRIFLITIQLAKKAGHHPHVVLTSPGQLSEELIRSGIPVTFLKLGILRRKYLSVGGLINRFWYIGRATFKLIKLIRINQIDLIYANACGIFAPAIASRLTGVAHLFHVHEVIERPKVLGEFTALFMKSFSDRTIVVSKAVRDSWVQYVPKLEPMVVYNGLDYDRFVNCKVDIREELGFSKETLIIGMIARVHFWKGQTYFLEIARKLLDLGTEARFVMVGDAFPGYEYLYQEIEAKRQQLGIDDQVIDLGFRSDIPEILQTLDVLVLPSINPDPLPTVILEAMASGRPVAATAHGGAREMLVDQETGVLIPWDDSTAAAQSIHEMISDRDTLHHMGESGRRRVLERFSLKAYQTNILEVIEN